MKLALPVQMQHVTSRISPSVCIFRREPWVQPTYLRRRTLSHGSAVLKHRLASPNRLFARESRGNPGSVSFFARIFDLGSLAGLEIAVGSRLWASEAPKSRTFLVRK